MKILKILFLVLLLSTAVVIAIDDEEGLDCDDLDIDADLDNPISGKFSLLYMYVQIYLPDAHGILIL